MEEFLSNLYDSSQIPFWSALLLGLMTAISPCPLATNITAMGFISKDIENKNRVFLNGLVYTLGRAFSYTSLALILFFGADQFKIKAGFEQYGEKFLGSILIVIGIFMLGLIKFKFPGFNKFSAGIEKKRKHTYLDVFILGVVFAIAFCPYSAILFFGMLIPLSIQSVSGLYLPFIYAIATGIPVIIFAWLLAYTLSGVGKFYNKIKKFEFWFRKIIAVVFLIIGIYYLLKVNFKIDFGF